MPDELEKSCFSHAARTYDHVEAGRQGDIQAVQEAAIDPQPAYPHGEPSLGMIAAQLPRLSDDQSLGSLVSQA